MIKSTDFESETVALERLIDIFNQKMKNKLIIKHMEDKRGWDNPKLKEAITVSLEDHVRKAKEDPRQWVDVANLAAMLWNFGETNG